MRWEFHDADGSVEGHVNLTELKDAQVAGETISVSVCEGVSGRDWPLNQWTE